MEEKRAWTRFVRAADTILERTSFCIFERLTDIRKASPCRMLCGKGRRHFRSKGGRDSQQRAERLEICSADTFQSASCDLKKNL
jgi:hypothetical protein